MIYFKNSLKNTSIDSIALHWNLLGFNSASLYTILHKFISIYRISIECILVREKRVLIKLLYGGLFLT